MTQKRTAAMVKTTLTGDSKSRKLSVSAHSSSGQGINVEIPDVVRENGSVKLYLRLMQRLLAGQETVSQTVQGFAALREAEGDCRRTDQLMLQRQLLHQQNEQELIDAKINLMRRGWSGKECLHPRCKAFGNKIGVARLEAKPHAFFCVECRRYLPAGIITVEYNGFTTTIKLVA